MSDHNKKNSDDKKDIIVDGLHEGTKYLASSVPLLNLLHALAVKSPMERRLNARLNKLEDDITQLMLLYPEITMNILANNPLFITSVSNVILIFLREHREEKLQALRNVTLNSALPNDIDEDIQLMFISLIDSFTTWHIKLLIFFSNNKWWEQLGYIDGDDELDERDIVRKVMILMSELNDEGFVGKVINDLSRSQLLRMPEVRLIQTSFLMLAKSEVLALNSPLLTELGIKFIKSINSPLEK